MLVCTVPIKLHWINSGTYRDLYWFSHHWLTSERVCLSVCLSRLDSGLWLTSNSSLQRQERKLVRLSSLRQLQAISHQLKLATKGRVNNLDFFKCPPGVMLQPIEPNQRRELFRFADGRIRVRFEQAATITVPCRHEIADDDDEPPWRLPDSPNWWSTLPFLVLQLDQGSPGCAGAACLVNYSTLIWFIECRQLSIRSGNSMLSPPSVRPAAQIENQLWSSSILYLNKYENHFILVIIDIYY